MADIELKARITAVDQASGVINNLKRSVDGLTAPIKQVQQQTLSLGQRMQDTGTQMIAWGKNTQWLGRQLMFNVSLPIIGIGAATMNMAMEVEKGWVRVKKVYGDAGTSTEEVARVQREILAPAVKSVSETFGIQQTAILDIMATYAAAGKTGKELADITAETVRLMTLGEIEVGTATEFLKNLMASYGMSVEDAKKSVDAFNSIENETFLQMKDLADAFPVAAGAFKGFNLSAVEGAAAIAGIAQRTGNASEAANALKFSFSRLAGGMPVVNDTLSKFNLQLFDSNGQMRKGTDVLKDIAKRMTELSDADRQEMLSRLFGNRQIVRMRALLEAVNDPLSDYNKALEVSADEAVNAATAQGELDAILQSAPKQYEINREKLRNLGIELGAKILPMFNKFIETAIIPLVKWFSNLSPKTQEWIIKLAALLAVLGPLMIVIASFAQVIGLVMGGLGKLITVFSGTQVAVAGTTKTFGGLKTGLNLLLLPGNLVVGIMDKLTKIAPVLGTNMGTMGSNFGAWKMVILQVTTSLKTLVLTTIPTAIKNIALMEISVTGITGALGKLKLALLGVQVAANVAFTIIIAAAAGAFFAVKHYVDKWNKELDRTIDAQEKSLRMQMAIFNRESLKKTATDYGVALQDVLDNYVAGTLDKFLQDQRDKLQPVATELGRMITEYMNQGMTQSDALAKLREGGAQISNVLLQTLVSQTAAAEGVGTALSQATAFGLSSDMALSAIQEHASLVTSDILANWAQAQLQSVPAGTLISEMLGSGISASAALGSVRLAGTQVNTTIIEELAKAHPTAKWMGQLLDEAVKEGIIDPVKRAEIEAGMRSTMQTSITNAQVQSNDTAQSAGMKLWNSISTGWKIAMAGNPLLAIGTVITKYITQKSTVNAPSFSSMEEAEKYWASQQAGGIIPSTGMYMMHKGESVTPEGSHTAGGGGISVNAYFYGDINESSGDLGNIGKKLARSLELARQGIGT